MEQLNNAIDTLKEEPLEFLTEYTFPIHIDASMLDAYRDCPKKFYWAYVQHLQLKSPSVHLHAGGAFARATEVVRKSFFIYDIPADLSVGRGVEALWKYYGDFEPEEKEAKTWDRMAGALVYYFDVHPLDKESLVPFLIGDQYSIEFTFAVPLAFLHPDTGEPMLYTGRADMIAKFRNDAVYCVDEKTTTRLGQQWMNRWPLRAQFIGYTHAANYYGYPVAGTIVRGISILKHEYGDAEAIVYHKKPMIEDWLETTNRTLESMARDFADDTFTKCFGSACAAYSGCEFTTLCKSPAPERWVDMYYERRVWNPLHMEGIE